MIYLLYLLILLPYLTDFLESRRLPTSLRELLTEFSLSILIGLGVHLFIRQRRQAHQQATEIQRLSVTDYLTGLANSQALEEALVKEVARARRMDRPLACIVLDLDDFRLMKDQCGHEKANEVLKEVARVIRGTIRRGMDQAFRSGEDEFTILLPEAGSHQALTVAQRLREAFIGLRPPAIPKRALSVSFGIGQLQKEQRAEDLIRMVHRALAQAKAKGKNMIYDAQLLET